MDRTAAFHRLAGVAAPAKIRVGEGAFLRAAEAQRRRLGELRAELRQHGGEEAGSFISECQSAMGQLETMAGDFSDLDEELRPKSAAAAGHLNEHRRCLVSSLFKELQEMATAVQSAQLNEMQRDAQVASFFSAKPSVETVVLKPPTPNLGKGFKAAPTDYEEPAAPAWSGGLPDDPGLAEEEQALLSTFTSELDTIQNTQKKLEEVSSMVAVFANKVHEQAEVIEQVLEDAEKSTDYVEQAEKHLTKAVENSTAYRFYVVCWFTGAAIFLLIYDFIDARYMLI